MAAGAGEGAHGPMHQFEINRFQKLDWFGFDASFTNSSLFMVAAVAVITGFLMWAMRSQSLVPGRVQSVAKLSYEYIENMVRENLGDEWRVGVEEARDLDRASGEHRRVVRRGAGGHMPTTADQQFKVEPRARRRVPIHL